MRDKYFDQQSTQEIYELMRESQRLYEQAQAMLNTGLRVLGLNPSNWRLEEDGSLTPTGGVTEVTTNRAGPGHEVAPEAMEV